jgi:hypothetical protein
MSVTEPNFVTNHMSKDTYGNHSKDGYEIETGLNLIHEKQKNDNLAEFSAP